MSKGQGHQAALLTTVLACQAAAVGMGTCWPWETATTLPSAWRCNALRRPERRGRGHIVPDARLQLVNNSHRSRIKEDTGKSYPAHPKN